ncbi:MAG: MFS transporter [Pseudomonadota bacterium]
MTRGARTGERRQPLIFYGWWVVAIAFVTLAISISARTSFSLLFPAFLEEFGWTRSVTAAAFSIGFLASTAFLPVIGVLMERGGPRLVIPLGAVMVASGFVLATFITTPLGLYLTMGVLMITGSLATSYIVHSMFMPAWFVRRRGLAIGIAFSGVGVGAITLLPAMQWVIDAYGWRTACFAMGALVLVVTVPLNALFQRSSPQEMGLEPDGGPPKGRKGKPAQPAPDPVVDAAWAAIDWTLARAARTARFWWLALAFFCGLFAWYAIQTHQTQYLLESGFNASVAAQALGLVALFGVAGQIALGWLSDRYGREVAWSLTQLGFALASLLLLALEESPSLALLYAMVACQGLLGYGLASLFGAVMTELFAGRQIGRIVATLSLLANLGAAVGVWFLGAIHDMTGSYALGFWVCAGLCLVSIVCIWQAAPRRVRLVAGQAARRAAAEG